LGTFYEPLKEEHKEITFYKESNTNRQLHALNEICINFFGKGTNNKVGINSILPTNNT
jgi:hypothetical protein